MTVQSTDAHLDGMMGKWKTEHLDMSKVERRAAAKGYSSVATTATHLVAKKDIELVYKWGVTEAAMKVAPTVDRKELKSVDKKAHNLGYLTVDRLVERTGHWKDYLMAQKMVEQKAVRTVDLREFDLVATKA
jgi:glycogen debranching enzyme